MATPRPPALVVEWVSDDSQLCLLSSQLTAVPDHVGVYELPETVIMFPPHTPLIVKAIFHANIAELILSVSSGGRLLISVIANVSGFFEACSSVESDSDLRITITKGVHDA